MSGHLRGITYMALGVSFFPVADATSKYLTGDYEPAQILWLRYLVQLAFIAPFVLSAPRRRALRTKRPGLHLLRAALTLVATIAFIASLSRIPLVEGISILFSCAFFTVALSALALREHVGVHRWSAVALGFAGVLIVMRPGMGIIDWWAIFALLSAFSTAVYQVATRKLSETDSALTQFFYVTIFGCVVLAPATPFVWVPMSKGAWLYVAAAGMAGGLGHWFMIKSLEHAPASVVAPFNYTQIVAATAIAALWFGELPDDWGVLGLAIVIASGLYIARRERLHAKRTPSP
jgi:drug/metabolite transporter (DMT)-like permease